LWASFYNNVILISMIANLPILLAMHSRWAITAVRIVFAAILLVHGLPKIKDLKATASNFEMMGFRPGILWGSVVAVVESVGGLLLLGGLFAQPIALFTTIEFTVIIFWRLRRHDAFRGTIELDLLMLVASLLLLTMGSGDFSLAGLFLF